MARLLLFFSLIFFYLFSALFCTSPKQGIVILVHGSFATNTQWHQPEGEFYETLKNSAQLLDKKLISFLWSGDPKVKSIQKAGKLLAEVIKSYLPNNEIIIIGHSHGGNVIAQASELLSPLPTEKTLSTIPHIIQSSTIPNLAPALSWTPTGRCNIIYHSSYPINKVYLLGTPINQATHKLNMDVIGSVYNFYSHGDFIQSVAGTHNKTHPQHTRISNICITIKNSGLLNSGKPTHSEMHHNLLARWLLFIPEELQRYKLGNFETFMQGQDILLHFEHRELPTIKKGMLVSRSSQESKSSTSMLENLTREPVAIPKLNLQIFALN